MIRFQLTCDRGHGHDSWFASNAAFEALQQAGRLECPICGSRRIEKALMAPAVSGTPTETAATADPDALARRLAALRRKIEEKADYVGTDFATEARAEEAKALIDDGIPVAPLPFMPRGKTN